MMLMVSATSFISLYMGLELQSLALYVLAAFNRDSSALHRSGPEVFRPRRAVLRHAAVRHLADLRLHRHDGFRRHRPRHRRAAASNIGLIFGLVFLIAGLAFKVSAVPFHMWTPDVYEGAPTPITAYLRHRRQGRGPRARSCAPSSRRSRAPLHQWQQIIIFISVLSMALGAFAAIGQTNIKRLMAYSSIGHMGYALLGLAAGTALGVRGVLIYLAYLCRSPISASSPASRRCGATGKAVENISDLAGLARTQPAAGAWPSRR